MIAVQKKEGGNKVPQESSLALDLHTGLGCAASSSDCTVIIYKNRICGDRTQIGVIANSKRTFLYYTPSWIS